MAENTATVQIEVVGVNRPHLFSDLPIKPSFRTAELDERQALLFDET